MLKQVCYKLWDSTDLIPKNNQSLEITIIFQDQHGNEWITTGNLDRDVIFNQIGGLDDLLNNPYRFKQNSQ